MDLTFITEQEYALDGFRYLCDNTMEFCVEFGLDQFRLTQNTREPLPREGQLFLAFGPRLDVGSRGLGFVEPTEVREIAGERSSCFDYAEIDPSYVGRPVICATREGIALAVTETGESYTIEMEASAFERQVDESIFEVPYPVTN